MQYVLSRLLSPSLPFLISLAGVACSTHADRPARDPSSTTRTTSSALTTRAPDEPALVDPWASTSASAEAAPPRRSAAVTGTSPADRHVSEKIRERLAQERSLENVGWNRLEIATVDGHVTVTGDLPTVADSCAVEHAVRQVKGVVSVTNDIRVSR